MHKMGIFPLRRAIERLRAGLFDPVLADRLTMENELLVDRFSKGLQALEMGESGPLCICGAYGEGKSHHLAYLHRQALAQGYATSLLQLDVREVPFSRFSVVYQSLMKNLSLPPGESLVEAWKKWSQHRSGIDVLDGMPHRFRMILQALLATNKLPLKKAKVKSGFKSKDFDYWLEEALMGHDLPLSYLKRILKARAVEGYRQHPLTAVGNAPYVQMVQAFGKLLNAMGYKGLVLFFDEAESIAQGRLAARVKSYEMLSLFFRQGGYVYPVFAFTEDFFNKVRSEEYGGDAPSFPKNYGEEWKSLQMIRLQDSSLARWEILLERLINLYAEAYQIDLSAKNLEIRQHMRALLEKLKTHETRFKLKALIHQLDIICIRTAS